MATQTLSVPEYKNYTLPQEFKETWIEGLTSGNYNQIEGVFYDSDKDNCGYCAIGVALSHCLNIDDSYLDNKLSISNVVEESFLSERELTIPWSFNHKVAYSDSELLEDEIMGMNDSERWSFKEIAEWIDNNVEGV